MAKIVCDKCTKEFRLKADDIKQTPKMVKSKVVEVSYFCCPHCGSPYIIQVLDRGTECMQSEYQKLYDRWEKLRAENKDEKQLQSVYSVLIAKKNKLAKRINALKEEFGEELKQYLN